MLVLKHGSSNIKKDTEDFAQDCYQLGKRAWSTTLSKWVSDSSSIAWDFT